MGGEMNYIFLVFLSLSCSAALITCVLLALRPFVRNRLNKSWQYYIWLIVILRLVIPLSPQLNPLNGMMNKITPSITSLTLDQEVAPDGIFPNPSGESGAVTLPVEDSGASPSVIGLLWVPWLGTAVFLFLRKVIHYNDFTTHMKIRSKPVSDPEITAVYLRVCSEMHIKKAPPLIYGVPVMTPMLAGIFRPCLILSEHPSDMDQLSFILHHELIHFKRLDMYYKWLAQIVVCLHWFNPFMYIMNREIDKYCELSCDEAVIRKLNQNERRQYGSTLISSIQKTSGRTGSRVPLSLSNNFLLLKERLDSIMKYKKKPKISYLIMALLTIILCTGATFADTYKIPPSSRESSTTKQDSLSKSMEPFKAYDLIYDAKNDTLFYQNKRVKAFADLKGTPENGGCWFNVGYYDSDVDSDLYLKSIRDGTGTITGIEKMPDAMVKELYDDMEAETAVSPKPEITIHIPELKAGEEHKYGPYSLKKGDVWTASLSWKGGGNAYIGCQAVKEGSHFKSGQLISSHEKINSEQFTIAKDGDYYFIVGAKHIKPAASVITSLKGSIAIKHSYQSYVFDATTYLNNKAIMATDKFQPSDIPKKANRLIAGLENTGKAGLSKIPSKDNLDCWFYYDSGVHLKWQIKTQGNTIQLYLYDDDLPRTISGPTVIHYTVPADFNVLNVYLNGEPLKLS